MHISIVKGLEWYTQMSLFKQKRLCGTGWVYPLLPIAGEDLDRNSESRISEVVGLPG